VGNVGEVTIEQHIRLAERVTGQRTSGRQHIASFPSCFDVSLWPALSIGVLCKFLIAGDRDATIVDMSASGPGVDDGKTLQEARAQFLHQVRSKGEEVGGIEVDDFEIIADGSADDRQAVAGMSEPLAQLCLGRESRLVSLPGQGWGLAAIGANGNDRQAGISEASRFDE
jgi:hypothetical protein